MFNIELRHTGPRYRRLFLALCRRTGALPKTAISCDQRVAATVAVTAFTKEHAEAFPNPRPHLQGRIRARIWKQGTTGRFELLKVYPICRWSGDLGPKITEGDRQAPEGFYTITPGLMNPNSNYYLAINTGFPNAYDRANDRHGGFLMIHGDCSSIRDQLLADRSLTFEDIANTEGVVPSYATRLFRLTVLAPDIVGAILSGKHPPELTARRLMDDTRLPLDWNEQRRCLGFASAT